MLRMYSGGKKITVLDVVTHACSPNTREVEAGEDKSLRPALATNCFAVSLGYTRPRLKTLQSPYIFPLFSREQFPASQGTWCLVLSSWQAFDKYFIILILRQYTA